MGVINEQDEQGVASAGSEYDAMPTPEQEPGTGIKICIALMPGGQYAVYVDEADPVTPETRPDGLFGLPDLETALKAVIVLDRKIVGTSDEDEDMMRGFNGDAGENDGSSAA